jgi:hypothetical protein
MLVFSFIFWTLYKGIVIEVKLFVLEWLEIETQHTLYKSLIQLLYYGDWNVKIGPFVFTLD